MLIFRSFVAFTLLGLVMTLSAQDKPVDAFPPTGGMWLPSQMPELEAQLRELGLEIDPQELADPTSNTLEAIVSLDGCSGSFVSKNGLIITNHHCVESYLSYMTEQDKAALKGQNMERTTRQVMNRALAVFVGWTAVVLLVFPLVYGIGLDAEEVEQFEVAAAAAAEEPEDAADESVEFSGEE